MWVCVSAHMYVFRSEVGFQVSTKLLFSEIKFLTKSRAQHFLLDRLVNKLLKMYLSPRLLNPHSDGFTGHTTTPSFYMGAGI